MCRWVAHSVPPDSNRATWRDATRTGPNRNGMPGDERALLYRTAIETGLRSKELRSLTRGGFHLTGSRPRVLCDAADTKNG